MTKNYVMKIEYDGSMYQGWQRQPGSKSVQGEIEAVLSKIYGSRVEIHGSGRTDAGVHGLNQVAHFIVDPKVPDEKLNWVLNRMLPLDIRIKEIQSVDMDFHSRYSAKGKKYIYKLKNKSACSSFDARYVWGVDFPLNIDLMRKAAKKLEGERDFSSFMASGSSAKTSIRKIHEITICEEGDEIQLEFYGNGFLYNMVRIMTALLVRIASGTVPLEIIDKIFQSEGRKYTAHTAPSTGLYLKEVIY